MKKIYYLLMGILCLMNLSLHAQMLEQTQLGTPEFPVSKVVTTQTVTDTIAYGLIKASGMFGISVNNVTSATALCQYFDAPQQLSVHGLVFYGWSTSLPSMNLTVNLYNAGNDSLPSGTPLATASVVVDTSFGTGTMPEIRYEAMFPSPVSVSNAYIISVENPSANNFTMIVNDYSIGDGMGEYLSSALLGNTWTKGYNLSIGGNSYDADAFIFPVVSYQLTAQSTATPPCIQAGSPTVFNDNSSAVFRHRMYNTDVFASGNPIIGWNFGDGTTGSGDGVSHSFAASGPYLITQHDTLNGYYVTVIDTSHLYTFAGAFNVSFAANPTGGLTYSFANISSTFDPNGFSSYLWDFGDGNTSTATSPTHTYLNTGTYTVCLTLTNSCVTDSGCINLNAVGVGIEEKPKDHISLYPNPANQIVRISTKDKIHLIYIHDVKGRLIIAEESKQFINVGHLPEGIYKITLITDNKAYSRKLLIHH